MADEQTTARKDFSETAPNLSEGNVGATNAEQAKHAPALLATIEQVSADEFLRTRTERQLLDALRRGEEQLRAITAMEATETFQGDGPERLSKAYERWSAADYANRRRMISMAMSDTRQELARRAALAQAEA